MIMSVNGFGRLNCPPGPFGMRACRMSFHIGAPFSVRYTSGLRLASMYIEAPLLVALMVPDRKARLLLVSSQASPPSSQVSFQKPTANFTDSMVSRLFKTTVLPSASTSFPPQDHKYGTTSSAHRRTCVQRFGQWVGPWP